MHGTGNKILKPYVSAAGSASVFGQEAPNLLDPFYQAIPVSEITSI